MRFVRTGIGIEWRAQKIAVGRIDENGADHICAPTLDVIEGSPQPAAEMRIVADRDSTAALSTAPNHNQAKIHFTSWCAAKDRSVSWKIAGHAPNLEIARRIGERSIRRVIDSVKDENVSNAAADMFGGNEIVCSDH